MKWQWALVLLVLAASFLVSDGLSSQSLPTRLQVTRTNSLPQNHIMPFAVRVIADAPAVQTLYDAILNLPSIPNGAVYFCPISFGITYQLTFFQGQVFFFQATLEADGCRFLHPADADTRLTDEAFWSLFAKVARIDADLHPDPWAHP